jgi:hypothetical protein
MPKSLPFVLGTTGVERHAITFHRQLWGVVKPLSTSAIPQKKPADPEHWARAVSFRPGRPRGISHKIEDTTEQHPELAITAQDRLATKL